jgi:cobalamin-dependent methionine synthase I
MKELSDQQKILKLLNGEKIGLTLTSAFQLIPGHSITGIILSDLY